MIETKIFDVVNKPNELEKKNIVHFLHDNLEEYGDPKKDITKAIDYSLKEFASFGGFIMLLKEEDKIKGAVVINQTGMGGYIPENILVYIAIHRNHRGEGLGKNLMKKVIEYAKGDIALHVEADNPAKFLYEKMGFTNPYLEMRLKK
ncbi:MAG: GNAT superfamily N-acetyltransferase [Halieaceae bacterium]|jgi:GNAT superfamily N-acetyltransferase